MNSIPRVAIVMPYYNERNLLLRSVEGVLKQTYKNYKLFIVDDGSAPANKAEVWLQEVLSSNYKTVKVINKPNSGVSDARNRALDHIKTEGGFDLIAYCDSDDVWQEMHLEEAVKALTIYDADMVYSNPEFRMVDGTVAVPFGIPFYEYYPGIDKLKQQNFIYISSVVHSIKCLSVGEFDRELNSLEDWDMWLRIAKAGYTIKQGLLKFPTLTYTCKINGNGSRRTEDIYQKVLKKHDLI
ncbi:MAG: glycosyltransferase family 2 protein, partial [Alphaproteobacteria bacterium]|nr:glycosyltransferase family 2 protein [Alphaproteobacteria bacterium]